MTFFEVDGARSVRLNGETSVARAPAKDPKLAPNASINVREAMGKRESEGDGGR
jgi:hypothetical protein